jgi:hypothetical protein
MNWAGAIGTKRMHEDFPSEFLVIALAASLKSFSQYPFSVQLPDMMILEATHTHLFPGHKGRISGLAQIADLQAGCECLVEFSDGSVAPARISSSENGWQLYTDAYRTAAGSEIAEKLWLVCLGEDDGHVEFRIRKKA